MGRCIQTGHKPLTGGVSPSQCNAAPLTGCGATVHPIGTTDRHTRAQKEKNKKKQTQAADLHVTGHSPDWPALTSGMERGEEVEGVLPRFAGTR